MHRSALVAFTCLSLIAFCNAKALIEYEDREAENGEEKDPMKNLPANGELFEEDMIMDDRLRRAVLGEGIKKSVLDPFLAAKWENNVIPYVVHKSFLRPDLLKQAIHEFHTRTCLRLKPRTNEEDYVEYHSDKNECSSAIGKHGGMQQINIGKDCGVLGTVLHETMHSLGIVHEHSRPDRDNHIKVNWKNIKKSEWGNFNKFATGLVDNEGVPYNFASVMHYRNNAFTKNGGYTVVPLNQPMFNFGQRIEWSVGDVQQINKLYNCKHYLEHPNYHGLFNTYSGNPGEKPTKKSKSKNQLSELERLLEMLF